jgi:hypothetical protein
MTVADSLDPTRTFSEILIEHGPVPEDDVVRRLAAAGVADPEDAFDELLDEIGSLAGQLIDERWVWLPTTPPAGRTSSSCSPRFPPAKPSAAAWTPTGFARHWGFSPITSVRRC